MALLKQRAMTEPPPGERRVRTASVRALAVLGQNDAVDAAVGKRPISGRGLRILSLDGGGMKGMAEVQMLRAIEARTGRRMYELFDVIGGTSTGCMVAMGCGVMRFTLDEMEDIYLNLGRKVFAASKAADGAKSAGKDAQKGGGWGEALTRMYRSGEESMRVAMYGSKYSAKPFEEMLQQKTRLRAVGCTPSLLCSFAPVVRLALPCSHGGCVPTSALSVSVRLLPFVHRSATTKCSCKTALFDGLADVSMRSLSTRRGSAHPRSLAAPPTRPSPPRGPSSSARTSSRPGRPRRRAPLPSQCTRAAASTASGRRSARRRRRRTTLTTSPLTASDSKTAPSR